MKDLKNTKKFKVADDLNDKALQMWHSYNLFDGQVVFHMDLLDDWYADADPQEFENSLAPNFDHDKPHLLIDTENIAHSLDDQEFIDHIFKFSHSIISEYKNFKNYQLLECIDSIESVHFMELNNLKGVFYYVFQHRQSILWRSK